MQIGTRVGYLRTPVLCPGCPCPHLIFCLLVFSTRIETLWNRILIATFVSVSAVSADTGVQQIFSEGTKGLVIILDTVVDFVYHLGYAMVPCLLAKHPT